MCYRQLRMALLFAALFIQSLEEVWSSMTPLAPDAGKRFVWLTRRLKEQAADRRSRHKRQHCVPKEFMDCHKVIAEVAAFTPGLLEPLRGYGGRQRQLPQRGIRLGKGGYAFFCFLRVNRRRFLVAQEMW